MSQRHNTLVRIALTLTTISTALIGASVVIAISWMGLLTVNEDLIIPAFCISLAFIGFSIDQWRGMQDREIKKERREIRNPSTLPEDWTENVGGMLFIRG